MLCVSLLSSIVSFDRFSSYKAVCALCLPQGPLPAAQSVQPEAPLQTPLSAFREPADLPAAAANAPSMDGTAPATAEGKLPPRSCAKRGRCIWLLG